MKNFEILVFGCFLFFMGCSNDNYESSQEEIIKPSLPKPIGEFAYNDYTQNQFPKLYQEWGNKWVEKIAEVEKAAVYKIANEHNACDSIEEAGISTSESTPKKEIVIFVNCTNGEQFYVSQNDLLMDTKSLANSEKSIDFVTAIENCKASIKTNTYFPATVKFGEIETFKGKLKGNVHVKIHFAVKNELNDEFSHVAECIYNPSREEEFAIIE